MIARAMLAASFIACCLPALAADGGARSGGNETPAPLPVPGVLVGSEIVLPGVSDAAFAAAKVDEHGDGHIIVREARTGALRYLHLQGAQLLPVELITATRPEKEPAKHLGGGPDFGMIIDGSGRPVVWSARHQFRRDAGDGRWREIEGAISCEQIVELRGQLICATVLPGDTVGAPKHWIGGCSDAGIGCIPWAWIANTDTLALFAEDQGSWRLLALVDRDSKQDDIGPVVMGVDSEERLHVVSGNFFRHTTYPASAGAGVTDKMAVAPSRTVDAPAFVADLQSSPVVIRLTMPNRPG